MNPQPGAPALAPHETFPRNGLAWSGFLGVSWTWCIGMFLPVLLVRDYGWVAWVIFAIPNVVGAAAMGWILPDAQSSLRLIRQHLIACAAFSTITIVFHVFFLAWVVHALIANAAWLAIFLVLVMVPLLGKAAPATALAWITFVFSMLVFVFVWRRMGGIPAGTHFLGATSPINLLGLAPVCVVGFVCCPYLDLTFHRARQSTAGLQGRVAFGVGFGAVFLLMILFTLWYAPLLRPGGWNGIPRVIALAIGLHLLIQSAFKIAAHARALAVHWSMPTVAGIVIALALGLPLLFAWMLNLIPVRPHITSPEITYRLFMGFYGLIFPAWFWMRTMHPRGGWSAADVLILCTATGVAAIFFWAGFIEGKMLWLLPGLAIILLAPLVGSPAPAFQSSASGDSPASF